MRRDNRRVLVPLLCAIAAVPMPLAASDEPPPTGIPHTCGAYYPPALQEQGVEGTTLLSFRVTRYGRVREITVSESSGNTDLDAAAVLCAQHWKYKPATQEGKPLEVPWVAKVVWKIAEPPAAPPTGPSARQ